MVVSIHPLGVANNVTVRIVFDSPSSCHLIIYDIVIDDLLGLVVVAILMFAWLAANGVAVCVITVCIVLQVDYFY